MSHIKVEVSEVIRAKPERVYAIIADYREGHPHILPRQYFTSLEVEEGGIGEGTIVRFQMRVAGKVETFRAVITEPEPGRVLLETDLESGAVTTFTVQPLEGGSQTRATITTEMKGRQGVAGVLERFFTKMFLRRVYTQELALLAALAGQPTPAQA